MTICKYVSYFFQVNLPSKAILTPKKEHKSIHRNINLINLFVCAQLSPTALNPMDCRLPGSSVHGTLPGKNTRVDCNFLLQGIFPTQGLNLLLLPLIYSVTMKANTIKADKLVQAFLISFFLAALGWLVGS